MHDWLHNIDVLITGGTGYLGRALAKALLASLGTGRICIFSRGEFAQAVMRRDLPDQQGRLRWFIGDVRDRSRLRRAMQGCQLVIHAAALKRVEVGEYNPGEMVLTNVMGAVNVIDGAIDAGVERVVAVSSDKACAPLNAYGATKLTMEKLLLAANNASGKSGSRFSVVRYGNVAGSTGSVIPTWREIQRAGGKAVPVSEPRCTRFWMTIQEAVDLILWTAGNMWGGELVVPLLPAYRLGDLAAAMDAEIELTGIGAGEKIDEMMIAPLESPNFRYHDPYLVSGGLAAQHAERNIGGIQPHVMDVEEIRQRLREL